MGSNEKSSQGIPTDTGGENPDGHSSALLRQLSEPQDKEQEIIDQSLSDLFAVVFSSNLKPQKKETTVPTDNSLEIGSQESYAMAQDREPGSLLFLQQHNQPLEDLTRQQQTEIQSQENQQYNVLDEENTQRMTLLQSTVSNNDKPSPCLIEQDGPNVSHVSEFQNTKATFFNDKSKIESHTVIIPDLTTRKRKAFLPSHIQSMKNNKNPIQNEEMEHHVLQNQQMTLSIGHNYSQIQHQYHYETIDWSINSQEPINLTKTKIKLEENNQPKKHQSNQKKRLKMHQYQKRLNQLEERLKLYRKLFHAKQRERPIQHRQNINSDNYQPQITQKQFLQNQQSLRDDPLNLEGHPQQTIQMPSQCYPIPTISSVQTRQFTNGQLRPEMDISNQLINQNKSTVFYSYLLFHHYGQLQKRNTYSYFKLFVSQMDTVATQNFVMEQQISLNQKIIQLLQENLRREQPNNFQLFSENTQGPLQSEYIPSICEDFQISQSPHHLTSLKQQKQSLQQLQEQFEHYQQLFLNEEHSSHTDDHSSQDVHQYDLQEYLQLYHPYLVFKCYTQLIRNYIMTAQTIIDQQTIESLINYPRRQNYILPMSHQPTSCSYQTPLTNYSIPTVNQQHTALPMHLSCTLNNHPYRTTDFSSTLPHQLEAHTSAFQQTVTRQPTGQSCLRGRETYIFNKMSNILQSLKMQVQKAINQSINSPVPTMAEEGRTNQRPFDMPLKENEKRENFHRINNNQCLPPMRRNTKKKFQGMKEQEASPICFKILQRPQPELQSTISAKNSWIDTGEQTNNQQMKSGFKPYIPPVAKNYENKFPFKLRTLPDDKAQKGNEPNLPALQQKQLSASRYLGARLPSNHLIEQDQNQRVGQNWYHESIAVGTIHQSEVNLNERVSTKRNNQHQ